MKESLALQKHFIWNGKIETKVKVSVETEEDLALAYTPGVADACLAIKENPSLSYELTGRNNSVAVITDGTAILGLGNSGALAGMPVMEGKCALFKTYGNVNAVPICLDTTDTEEIIKTVRYIQGNFAGINLEDISAPRCFEIENRLKSELDIPVFHDDQHGTAIVVGAALINACRLLKKDVRTLKAVVNGAGAAGIAIGKFLLHMGVRDVIMVDRCGILCRDVNYSNPAHNEIARRTNVGRLSGTLADALKGADLFVGVSVGNIVSEDMIRSMASKPIVFALANPVPEISPDKALAAGAEIVGTGSSEYPNQINNALVFPGLFRGALDVRARDINEEMMMAAAEGIARAVTDRLLSRNYILPKAVDRNAHELVANAVRTAAVASGVARK